LSLFRREDNTQKQLLILNPHSDTITDTNYGVNVCTSTRYKYSTANFISFHFLFFFFESSSDIHAVMSPDIQTTSNYKTSTFNEVPNPNPYSPGSSLLHSITVR